MTKDKVGDVAAIGCVVIAIAFGIVVLWFVGTITVWLWAVRPLWAVIWLAFWIIVMSLGGSRSRH